MRYKTIPYNAESADSVLSALSQYYREIHDALAAVRVFQVKMRKGFTLSVYDITSEVHEKRYRLRFPVTKGPIPHTWACSENVNQADTGVGIAIPASSHSSEYNSAFITSR